MRHSSSISAVIKVLDAAARRGVNASVACAAADIDPAALADPDDRLPFARVVRLFDACAWLSGDAAFGLHAGEASGPAIFDVVGCSGVTGSTVGESDAALTGRLDDDAQALFPSASVNGSLAGRVCLLLARALRGADPDLATIARELGLSTRTLQRRLYGEDTSLHDLIDDVRRDLSIRYLEHRDLTMTDVAYLLGFADGATFHRAFRKWIGLTPEEFQRTPDGAPRPRRDRTAGG